MNIFRAMPIATVALIAVLAMPFAATGAVEVQTEPEQAAFNPLHALSGCVSYDAGPLMTVSGCFQGGSVDLDLGHRFTTKLGSSSTDEGEDAPTVDWNGVLFTGANFNGKFARKDFQINGFHAFAEARVEGTVAIQKLKERVPENVGEDNGVDVDIEELKERIGPLPQVLRVSANARLACGMAGCEPTGSLKSELVW